MCMHKGYDQSDLAGGREDIDEIVDYINLPLYRPQWRCFWHGMEFPMHERSLLVLCVLAGPSGGSGKMVYFDDDLRQHRGVCVNVNLSRRPV